MNAVNASVAHSFVSARGARLHVTRGGRGNPLLLLHGWPEHGITWQPVINRLDAHFELFAPDLRGFGDSDNPDGDFGPAQHAADIAALIEALGIGPVGVVSHDIGATVVQHLARKAPTLISGLFFFNFLYPGIGARFTTPAHLPMVWHTYFNQSALAPVLLRSSPNAIRLYLTHWIQLWSCVPDAVDAATVEAFVRAMEQPGKLEAGLGYYRAVAAQRAREHTQRAAPSNPIAFPTSVRWSDHDPALDLAWTDRLGDYFTNLDLAPFPNAGHFPHHEAPDRAAHEIRRFFTALHPERWIS